MVQRARQVAVTGNGQKVFAYASGRNAACDGGRFQGRQLALHGGRNLYGIISECCDYPLPYDVSFVEHANWFGRGISRHLKAKVTSQTACPEFMCNEVIAEYDGNKWVWTFGPIKLTMTVSGGVATFALTGSTCSVSFLTPPQVTCQFPFRGSVRLQPDSVDCCNCCPSTTTTLVIEIEGFCHRRQIGRFVGYHNGIKVYATANACPEVICPGVKCCVDYNCSIQACFMGLGSCTCLDGLCIDLTPSIVAGKQRWQNNLFSSCDHQWDARLECKEFGEVGQTFNWQMSCNPNCSVNVDVPVLTQCSNNFDIEFEFTLECPTCNPSPPAPIPPCCDCGNYNYLVVITRANC